MSRVYASTKNLFVLFPSDWLISKRYFMLFVFTLSRFRLFYTDNKHTNKPDIS